jgi:cellulose synthase/poly-beta-1,6-N-acetylglucosamine synthase-like glycosyltransferase
MLSVVIPCQEDHVLLFPTVKSIFLNQFCSEDFEVILICNNSFIVSEKVNRFPIQVYRGAFENQAQALNWSLERARGDIICMTKPGCIVASNWLSEIALFLQHNPKICGVGGPVLPCLDYGTKIQKLASQIFYEEQGFPDSVTILKSGSYQGLLHATNSAFRKAALTMIKFDESFRYDYDFDVCWKMLEKGYCLAYNPEMKVEYIFPLSIRGLLNRYYCWGKENVVLRKKCFPGMDVKSFLYTPYNTVRSLLQPSSLMSTKKLLRFIQHLAFNLGCIRGYGVQRFVSLS